MLFDVFCFFQIFGERFSDEKALGFVRIFVNSLFLLLRHLFVNLYIHKGISILPAVASTSSSWQVGNGQYFDRLSEAIRTNT